MTQHWIVKREAEIDAMIRRENERCMPKSRITITFEIEDVGITKEYSTIWARSSHHSCVFDDLVKLLSKKTAHKRYAIKTEKLANLKGKGKHNVR